MLNAGIHSEVTHIKLEFMHIMQEKALRVLVFVFTYIRRLIFVVCVLKLVGWCFEPSQPLGITPGLAASSKLKSYTMHEPLYESTGFGAESKQKI